MYRHSFLWLILLIFAGSAVFLCGCQSELDRRDPAKKYSRIPYNSPADWQSGSYSN